MAKKEELIYNLTWTKAFFKFGFAHLDSLSDLQFLDIFAYGRHTATKEELELTEEQQNYMPTILQHVSAYILVTQMDTALQKTIPDRFNCQKESLKNAAWICRLLRNAFTHNPFNSTWIIYNECKNKNYVVNDIISLDTAALHEQPVTRPIWRPTLPIKIIGVYSWYSKGKHRVCIGCYDWKELLCNQVSCALWGIV